MAIQSERTQTLKGWKYDPVPNRTNCQASTTLRAEHYRQACRHDVEMAFSGQNVTPETLESYGFSKDVVERYGARATALARRRSIRRIERYI
ncbi:hypothetical protein HED54_09910 [Ochrobactrum anthropi ATCC 49188]|nr:hypothetical protein [Brucella anthropi ATCC 49188]